MEHTHILETISSAYISESDIAIISDAISSAYIPERDTTIISDAISSGYSIPFERPLLLY